MNCGTAPGNRRTEKSDSRQSETGVRMRKLCVMRGKSRPDDDATIIHFIFYFNFDYGDKLSNDSPNYYGMVDNHQEMLQEIRNFGK